MSSQGRPADRPRGPLLPRRHPSRPASLVLGAFLLGAVLFLGGVPNDPVVGRAFLSEPVLGWSSAPVAALAAVALVPPVLSVALASLAWRLRPPGDGWRWLLSSAVVAGILVGRLVPALRFLFEPAPCGSAATHALVVARIALAHPSMAAAALSAAAVLRDAARPSPRR